MKRTLLLSWRILVGAFALVGVIAVAIAVRVFLGFDTHSRAAGAPDPGAMLQRLAGEWRLESVSGTPELGAKLVGRPAGAGVYTVFRDSGPHGEYRADALWCYDSKTARVHVLEVNSLGQVFDYVGVFGANGTLENEGRRQE